VKRVSIVILAATLTTISSDAAEFALSTRCVVGRIFDILGKVFEETSLKNLLMEAIRYGDHSDIHAWLNRKIDLALDHDHLSSLLNRNALAQETVRTRSPGWYCPSPRNRALLRLPIFQW